MKVDITLLIVAVILAVIAFYVIRCAWPLLVVLVLAYIIYKWLEKS
ncbi:MAG: hypothetical protein HXS40_11590 [Theionarchaea archaeon]|nr:hypothetical protein [Theionarchaea archaeon]